MDIPFFCLLLLGDIDSLSAHSSLPLVHSWWVFRRQVQHCCLIPSLVHSMASFPCLHTLFFFLTKLLVFVTDHLPGLTLHTRDVAEHLWLWLTVTNWAPFSECGTYRAFICNCHTLILWPENVPCLFAPRGYSQLTFSFSKKIPLTSPVGCLPAHLVVLCISEQYVVWVSWVTGKCFPTLF